MDVRTVEINNRRQLALSAVLRILVVQTTDHFFERRVG